MAWRYHGAGISRRMAQHRKAKKRSGGVVAMAQSGIRKRKHETRRRRRQQKSVVANKRQRRKKEKAKDERTYAALMALSYQRNVCGLAGMVYRVSSIIWLSMAAGVSSMAKSMLNAASGGVSVRRNSGARIAQQSKP